MYNRYTIMSTYFNYKKSILLRKTHGVFKLKLVFLIFNL